MLYDGVCGLCDRFIQFLIRIDRRDRLRFAALQGPLGALILKQNGLVPGVLSTVIVVANYGSDASRVLDRSEAALFAIYSTGGVYRGARVLRIVPRFLRDWVYTLIARSRYRLFGQLEACPVPKAENRRKFLDPTR